VKVSRTVAWAPLASEVVVGVAALKGEEAEAKPSPKPLIAAPLVFVNVTLSVPPGPDGLIVTTPKSSVPTVFDDTVSPTGAGTTADTGTLWVNGTFCAGLPPEAGIVSTPEIWSESP
jgi:hypothetical protein